MSEAGNHGQIGWQNRLALPSISNLHRRISLTITAQLSARLVGHLLILLIGVGVFFAVGTSSQFTLSTSRGTASYLGDWPAGFEAEMAAEPGRARAEDVVVPPDLSDVLSPHVTARDLVANATVAAQRTEPVSYTIQPGDTVHSLAERFGITADSIIWSNGLDDANSLSIGQQLIIPPVTGVLHTVHPGDTITTLAAYYGVNTSAITGWPGNQLASADAIQIGQKLMVPGGKVVEPVRVEPSARGNRPLLREDAAAEEPAPPRSAPNQLSWPTHGPITTYFMEAGHRGLDIAPPYGTPVRAVAAGQVITAVQLDYSWGWYIVIDHGGGLQTLYGHLSRFDVSEGEWVEQGQRIGLIGSTGKSTGPHLHLEMIRNGALVNPLTYLP